VALLNQPTLLRHKWLPSMLFSIHRSPKTQASGELQCTLKYISVMAARLGRTREITPKVTLLYCEQNTGHEFKSTPIWQSMIAETLHGSKTGFVFGRKKFGFTKYTRLKATNVATVSSHHLQTKGHFHYRQVSEIMVTFKGYLQIIRYRLQLLPTKLFAKTRED
jgi:hypothetical protein